MNKLLQRQLKRSTHDGVVDQDMLLALVDDAYREAELERERQDNANRTLSEELTVLNERIRGEAEDQVRALLAAVGDGIVVVDDAGRIEMLNRAAQQIFGYGGEELRGAEVTLLWPDHAEELAELTEVEGLRKDGERFPAERTASLLRLGRREVTVFIVRDVSQRKQGERALREAMARAEAASKAKSEFLATMSHEIRTPMNGVIGMVGLLLDSELSLLQRSRAEAIRESSEALLLIINDILDFSKVEAGRLELELHDFTIASVVESVVELLAPRAFRKGLEIASLLGAGLPARVRGDAGRLRQILMNLASNAVKFTAAGQVTLGVELERIDGTRSYLRFEIVDTGIGVDAQQLGKLFQEFVQVDASTTRRFGGTGLGLAISRKLVQLMGGDIGVRSRLGEGSTFWVVIPLEILEGAAELAPIAPGRRVLIVDDTPTNCQIFERQFASWGVETTAVSSGDLALAAMMKAQARGAAFDLVVTDHHMPEMDGHELTRTIKSLPMFADVPVILASSGVVDQPDGVAMFHAVLSKPVRPSELQVVVAQLFGTAAAPAPSATPPEAKAERYAQGDAPVRYRLLVAEDNHINARVAMGYLENDGHRVDLVATGLEAVEAVRRFPYDLVLMDMQMPELDGVEATRAIRKLQGERSQIPIVALTANAMRADSERCFEAGMQDHLPKPFDKTALLDKARRWGAIGAALHGQRRCAATSSPPPMNRRLALSARPPAGSAPVALVPSSASVASPVEGMAAQSDLRAGFSAQVAELAEVGELMFQLAEGFGEELPGQMAALRRAQEARDMATLTKLAHDLIGSAGSLGFYRLSATARQLQRLGRCDPPQTEEVLELLLGQLREVHEFITGAELMHLRRVWVPPAEEEEEAVRRQERR